MTAQTIIKGAVSTNTLSEMMMSSKRLNGG